MPLTNTLLVLKNTTVSATGFLAVKFVELLDFREKMILHLTHVGEEIHNAFGGFSE